jgi:hypothetical protein
MILPAHEVELVEEGPEELPAGHGVFRVPCLNQAGQHQLRVPQASGGLLNLRSQEQETFPFRAIRVGVELAPLEPQTYPLQVCIDLGEGVDWSDVGCLVAKFGFNRMVHGRRIGCTFKPDHQGASPR